MNNQKGLRVLIIRNAYQKDTGGAEQYAYNLALALKRAGHIPFVVTKHKAIHDKCRAEDIKTVRGIWHESQEWSKHYYIRFLFMPLWYCWLILRFGITVVNPQSRDDFVFASYAGRLLGKRVLWTDHADLKYIMDRKGRPHPRMQRWILGALGYASWVMCASNSEKKLILDVAPEFKDKLVVVHNGVFKPSSLMPVEKNGKFVIGTNARLTPAKGISELLESFAAVAKGRLDTELWLMGGYSGNKKKYEQEAEGLGIAGQVKLLGYVPNPDDYVVSMDIFVHPSYHEAFSLAIIEACVLGRPVIATAVGGTPEIINSSTGILVPPKDTPALASALKRLISDEQLRTRLGHQAQDYALAHFEFQKIVETKIIPLYERK